MDKLDGRKISHEALEEIRIRAVRRVLDGEYPEEVIKALGFSRSCIFEWLASYREGGWDALRAKKLEGRPRKLNGAQMAKLYDLITLKNPRQLQLDFGLWTRKLVREIIQREFDVSLSEVSVGRLLRAMGLTPQKPLYKAYQRDAKRVERWLKEDFPAIRTLAKNENATILWGDESGVRSDYHSGRTWAEKGKTPVVEASGTRVSMNMIAAISARGELRFMLVDSMVNGEVFTDFLKRLVYKAERPIFLILDNLKVHHCEPVKKFVESTNGMLRLFFLPPFSPHLNPSELVWNQIKNHGIGKKFVKTKEDVNKTLLSLLRSLQKSKAKVRSFFREQNVQYAVT